jgi:hypothetical protein
METNYAPVQVECGVNLWTKDRYRVELMADLYCGFERADAAVLSLGYRMIDAGEEGRSYDHRADPDRTAELDDDGEVSPAVRLLLRRGDLEPTVVSAAAGELEQEYAAICVQCGMPRGLSDRYVAALSSP